MGLLYHAALENSQIMCFMDSRLRHFRYFSVLIQREQNEVDDFLKNRLAANRDIPYNELTRRHVCSNRVYTLTSRQDNLL